MQKPIAYKGTRQCPKDVADRITNDKVDDKAIEWIDSTQKLRILLQLNGAPRILMDLYAMVGRNTYTARRIRELADIGLIEYCTLDRKQVVVLTEKGERAAAHLKAMLDVLNDKIPEVSDE